MKKIKYIILSIFSIATLFSCSDTEDIRNDIDDLNARLDKIEAMLPQINQDIENYQGILNGNILVLGHRLDENTGDYTLDLSNGTTITVYSSKVVDEDIPKMTIGEDNNWYYTINGETKPLLGDDDNPVSADPINGKTPEVKVNSKGEWIYRFDGGEWIEGIGVAYPSTASGVKSIFDEVIVSPDGNFLTFKWTTGEDKLAKTISVYGGLDLTIQYETSPVVFGLGETKKFTIEQEGVEKIVIETMNWVIKLDETEMTVTAPSVNTLNEEYEDKLVIKIFSKEGFCRLVTMPVKLLTTKIDEGSATAWQNFLSGNENILLDYSYAGYKHGEGTPPDAFAMGYTVKNIKDYKVNGVSDRQAFINILAESGILATKELAGEDGYKNRTKEANLVIYFPEGTYVLHNDDDNTTVSDKQQDAKDSKGNNVSTAIKISASNLIIKGDGPGKTIIKMETPNLPTSVSDTGSSPEMINIGHTNGLDQSGLKESTVSQDALKGAYSVSVSDASWIKAGDWVQLRTRSDNSAFVSEELGPIVPKTTLEGGNWSITESVASGGGVKITEFHQVKSVSANEVTFYEPIMHRVNKDYNWILRQYKYLYNVGIEGITFVGNALNGYSHHGDDNQSTKDELGWQYDGAYKPLVLSRVVNSWVRNVNFTSVSEAVSLNESANSSAYNITIDGMRGHSAVRAQHSTRVFIGRVNDISTGNDAKGNPCNGQFHGCGVSKPSIGCVIWNSTWGKDACFESHATQPRATLFDNCRGGLVYYRAGGAEKENPNHLADLTIWNLAVEGTDSHAGAFSWWSNDDRWWKIYPPIVVGTHGQNVTFAEPALQMTHEESTGTKVTPESLYEAQLRKRLGYVPAWLNALK